MDLYINHTMIENLEQLKGCFRSSDSNVRNELLSYVRNGCLKEWLKEGDSQEEEKLANEVENLDFSADDNILWNEVYKIVVGEGLVPKAQSYSRCFELEGISSPDSSVKVRKSAKNFVLNSQRDGEVELCFSFKVLTLARASVNLYLCNEQKQRSLLGCIDLKQKAVIKLNTKIVTCEKLQLLADDEMMCELNVNPKDLIITIKEGVEFKMIFVEGGTFQMGQDGVATPVHSVSLSDYYIGETEVTQALWKAVMGSNPSYWKGDNRPVEMVSWDDCQEFIHKLNQMTGQRFVLPTEAQWEYAARGGNKSRGYTYSGSNNIFDVAWYKNNSLSQTHPVSTKMANELGLYDMSGNVWEWCQDYWCYDYPSSSQIDPTGAYTGYSRVMRGGSWKSSTIRTFYDILNDCKLRSYLSKTPEGCSSVERSHNGQGCRVNYLGLRLALHF